MTGGLPEPPCGRCSVVRLWSWTRQARSPSSFHQGAPASRPSRQGCRRTETPGSGLRREEVASLAGVSIDYYKRLERGNLRGVSEQVLEALAQRCSSTTLNEHTSSTSLARGPSTPHARRSRTRQPVRRSCSASSTRYTPAIVRNTRSDYLAANQLPRTLRPPLRQPRAARKQPRFLFLDPAASDFYTEWDLVADELVAHLRSDAGRNPYDRGLTTWSANCPLAAPSSVPCGPHTTSVSTAPAPSDFITRSSATSS